MAHSSLNVSGCQLPVVDCEIAMNVSFSNVLHVQVHPLVVQCYKSAACFATCWLALLAVPLRFTWWGTAAAAIWVRTLMCRMDCQLLWCPQR